MDLAIYCGKCDRRINSFEESKLKCPACGYTFFSDKWQLKKYVPGNLFVSTVDLEMVSGIHRYETMIFDYSEGKDGDSLLTKRYRTKEEAIKGHAEVLKVWDNPVAKRKLLLKVKELGD